LLCLPAGHAADYRPPAGVRPATKRPGGETILPGGRFVYPLGKQYQTGPAPWGLAVSPNGKRIVSADGGSRRVSLTVLDSRPEGWHVERKDTAGSSSEGEGNGGAPGFLGLAFDGNDEIYASEGAAGSVRLMDVTSGKSRQHYDLNGNGFSNSFAGDLVFDAKRRLLFVADAANFRVAVIDTKKHRVVANIRIGRLPGAIALSPDGKRLYATSIGLFDHAGVGSAPAAAGGATGGLASFRLMGAAEEIPALASSLVKESVSLTVVDVANPSEPQVVRHVPAGRPFARGNHGGAIPPAVAATEAAIYVTDAGNDAVTVVDAKSLEVQEQVLLRVPGLENLRGILPVGMAIDGQKLYVTEAGINAIGVIDLTSRRLTGHMPAGWFPTRVLVRDGTVYAVNAKGNGTGPNATLTKAFDAASAAGRSRGTISVYRVPGEGDTERNTARVLTHNGLDKPASAVKLPQSMQYVVLIVKGNRSFDEILGDIVSASNAPVNGAWDLARFGQYAVVTGDRGTLQQRVSMRSASVTPNHHALAEQFAISDNFYADSDVSIDGRHWLAGVPGASWTEAGLLAAYGGRKDFRIPAASPGRVLFSADGPVHPEEQLAAGAVWRHLDLHNVPYRNASPGYPAIHTGTPDHVRAGAFIREIQTRHVSGSEPLPRFLFLHLPNDQTAPARPDDGYPFGASYVADNDYAVGRVVEFLSKSPWWKQMAVFVTQDGAEGTVDHVDTHRTLLLAAGPYVRRNYVSKTNTSMPGLLKTVFQILGVPPLSLFDATAAGVADCFTETPDFAPYLLKPIRPELFDPAKTAR